MAYTLFDSTKMEMLSIQVGMFTVFILNWQRSIVTDTEARETKPEAVWTVNVSIFYPK